MMLAVCHLPGFDKYFRSLRPPVRDDDCVGGRPRRPHINCRDIWFHEFWSQVFNCTFERTERGVRRCSGNESLTKYKQEGLVPFVGEWAGREGRDGYRGGGGSRRLDSV